ncbi:helix-turn-helix transcriptional regulator [Thermonema rossianum]|uniref:helix-turn-helix transcriptional regulator n=1 Tax=Thermonema rossianum TaxID=55505 RepID=UPI00056F7A80|nr:transcriptional regulator [Thermonema rossianum]
MIDKNRPRARVLRLLVLLIQSPYVYTLKELAEKMGVNERTIKRDLEELRNAGFVVDYDRKYRYALRTEEKGKELRDLLYFSGEEQEMLYRAIDSLPLQANKARRLKEKLGSLYDFHKLGLLAYPKPFLTKIERLAEAQKQKRQVLLKNYRSVNSNETKDRRVEVFELRAAEDLCFAYDLHRQGNRIFRPSRCGEVVVLDEPWQYEHKHRPLPTDPFLIVDEDQVTVDVRLKTGGYNLLIEQFPLCTQYCERIDAETYAFRCKVNHQFIGLTNFLLGNHEHVIDIVAPGELVAHLQAQFEKMVFLKKGEKNF